MTCGRPGDAVRSSPRGPLTARCGNFSRVPRGLLPFEVEPWYTHDLRRPLAIELAICKSGVQRTHDSIWGDVHVSYLEEDTDRLHMQLALREARAAAELGEVPVGAIVIHPEYGIVAKASNRKETLRDASAHAEILAIGQASIALGGWRLEGCTLYVTLEPCPMCAGAIIQSRIPRLVFGAHDPKAGAVGSVVQLLEPGLFNHEVVWQGGVLAEQCGEVLSAFFREKRERKS